MSARVDPESFGFLITDIARLFRAEIDRRVAEAGIGLTAGEARALSHVARAGSARQTVLAERLGVEAMTISSYLDRLEAHGLIERRPDPSDRRAKLVSLTDAADAMLMRIAPVSTAVRNDAAADLNAPEFKQLMDMLRRVRASLTAARSAGLEDRPAA